MKAVVFQSPGTIDLVDAKCSAPEPDWARIQVRATAICMTDFEVLHGTIQAQYPIIPGHEWSGVVDATGSSSDREWIGRRVVGDNELTCLRCRYCRKGEWRRCAQYRQLGFEAPGAYAEYILVPIHNLHELPDSISFEQGALLEPMAVGLAVLAMAQPQVGATAVILGVGPIGLNCLAVLKASGVIRILCIDLRERRLELARAWGALATCNSVEALTDTVTRWHPGGADLVIDTTGNQNLIQSGLSLVRFGGAFVLAGYCGGRSIELKLDVIHERNLRVLGAGNNSGFMETAVRCAADGILRTEEMITHRYRLEDYKSALSRDTIAAQDYIKGIFVQ